MNDKARRPKVEWIEDKIFEDQETGLSVVVQKLPLFHPRFSIFIGTKTDRGVSRFIRMRSEGRGKITINRIHETIAKLTREAEDYIWSELQYHEDQVIDGKLEHEQRQLDKSKHKPRRGLSGGPGSGKTARKRENKRKRASAG